MLPLLTLVLGSANSSDTLFADPAILAIRIDVDAAGVASLAKEPRKYVSATVRIGSDVWQNVGMHLKGQKGSSFRPWNEKPALTFNTDKFDDKLSFFGMDKWHLNNHVEDPTYQNDLLTGDLFSAAGVPAGRSRLAFVHLNDRPAGIYILKEGYDSQFLKRYFGDHRGNLYDGGYIKDIDHPLELLRGKDVQHADLKAVVEAARIKDHAKRLAELDRLVDLERFYALWAIEVLCVGRDAYARAHNNYRIYFDPKSGKMTMIAHGKDEMFEEVKAGLIHGWNGLLSRSLFETEAGRARYIATLRRVYEKHFDKAAMLKAVAERTARIRERLNAEKLGVGDEYAKVSEAYAKMLAERFKVIEAELAKLK